MEPGINFLDNLPPITGQEEHSFASYTIRNRLPHVIDMLIAENNFSRDITIRLERLKENVQDGKITFVPQHGQAARHWAKWIKPFIGQPWVALPFYLAEAYFYRLVLEFSDFFSSEKDPFFITKSRDIYENKDRFPLILDSLNAFFQVESDSSTRLKYLLSLCLWGNKSDLSQLNWNSIRENERSDEKTIINDDEMASTYLTAGVGRVDIVLDNSGLELFTDLVLAAQLVSLGIAKHVVLHAKKLPTFVSDATKQDIRFLSDFLSKQNHQHTQNIAEQLDVLLSDGAISIDDHEFWNAPLHFYEMPSELHRDLQKSDMIIFKGDANYRRIFGDKQLPVGLHLEDATQYMPSTSLAVRILKSEIMAGLGEMELSRIKNFDEQWMVNGMYGIIQMVKR